MDLKLLVRRLEEFAALETAMKSDNVGLLVEPSGLHVVRRALVTNDLTEPVLEEAISKDVQLIISYHPAIWNDLKRLTQAQWEQRKIVKCIENRIAVFSPHTSWDSIEIGSNYWLLQPFDTKKIQTVKGQEVKSKIDPCGFSKNVRIHLKVDKSKEQFLRKLEEFKETVRFVSEREVLNLESTKQVEIEVLASAQGVVEFIEAAKSIYSNNNENILETLRIYDLDKPYLKQVGLGRIGYLAEPLKIRDVVQKMKTHLKMKTLRLALAVGKTQDDMVQRIAVGAGNASGILNNVDADIIITGEFEHHEILHENHRGVSVILADHSNTERGYARFFLDRFLDMLKKNVDSSSVEIIISQKDREPLEYV